MVFIDNSPSVRASLASAGALASWPSLYATDTVRAEHRGYGFNDFRADSVLRSVQVVDVGALRAATQGRPVTVTAVTADSVASDRDEAVNVFDGDRSPDGATAWLSVDTPGPHQLEFTLGEPIPLSGLDVVLPGKDQAGKDQWGSRADVLEIQVRDPAGGYHVVWRGTGLARYPLVRRAGEPVSTTAVRLVFERTVFPTRATDQAAVEEIVLPGYLLAGPAPSRALAPLVLEDLRATPEGLVVAAQNPTARTVLVHDGVRHALRPLQSGELGGCRGQPERDGGVLFDRHVAPLQCAAGRPHSPRRAADVDALRHALRRPGRWKLAVAAGHRAGGAAHHRII